MNFMKSVGNEQMSSEEQPFLPVKEQNHSHQGHSLRYTHFRLPTKSAL